MASRQHKPYKRRFQFKDHQGLLIFLGILLSLTFVFYFFSGCSLIPDDMVNIPTVTTETEETEQTEPLPIIKNPILITEIVSSNQSTLQAADGSTPDWIEFFNSGSTAVNLEGYALSDNVNQPNKWVFPSIELEPGDYLVVYASGLTDPDELAAAADHGESHASFALSSSGEELIFTGPTGQVLARLDIPEIPTDLSWGLLDTAQDATDPCYFFSDPTPGNPNGLDGHEKAEDAIDPVDCDLLITEYVTRQDRFPDHDGDYADWVELYNDGSEPFDFSGLYFSDNPNDPQQWVFPDVTLMPDAYLLVWLSGKTMDYDPANPATLHAPFRLGENDEALVLTDAYERLLLEQPIEELPLNVSKGRAPDLPENWLYYPHPTPGEPNTTEGFASLEGALMLKHRGVWINEVVALDANITRDGKTNQPDWIELYNGTDGRIDLTGYGLSDDPEEPYLERLDGVVLEPGHYTVITPENFGIASDGEMICLTDPDGVWIDRFETGSMRNKISSGRGDSDGQEPADSRFYYTNPTPGEPNRTPAASGIAITPSIEAVTVESGELHQGLYLDEPVWVRLVSTEPNATIRYTLDGTYPDEDAPVYREPIRIDRTTVLRCLSVTDTSLSSPTVVRTFLKEEHHDLPVVSIIAEPDDFFDPNRGLWTRYTVDYEYPAEIDYYETDGTRGIHFAAGINLHGSYSRTEKQKSMELKMRAVYGDAQVTYPFFDDNEVMTFKRLILRTSGQDWRFTKLRDIFMTDVIQDHTELDTMDFKPCVVYINGEYFGLYNLREKVDQYYMASHHGADPENVDIIKGNKIILNGDYEAYGELLRYVRTHDMRDPEAYAHVLDQIDEHSLMDFVIAQTFFNNLDSGNKKFWRERTEGAQWRWVFFDLDWAMFPTTYTKNILKYDLLDPAGHGQQDIFDSTLQVKLMQNPDFKNAFIERYAWYLNNVFVTDRMLGILDGMTDMIRGEMPRQIERWGGPSSMDYWENQVAELRRITGEKRARMLVILKDTFAISSEQMKVLFPEDF